MPPRRASGGAIAAVRRAVAHLDARLAVWDEAELATTLRSATARERSLAYGVERAAANYWARIEAALAAPVASRDMTASSPGVSS